MALLDSIPISVDTCHFRNHVGNLCRKTMNSDKNPCSYLSILLTVYLFWFLVLQDINTQTAEQTISWFKQYAQIISNLNYLRAPLFMLVLFHLKNLSIVNKSPSYVCDVVS